MNVVDLFCGCGGLSKGFELAGFNVIAAFDNWKSAITCYNSNFKHTASLLDLSNLPDTITKLSSYNPQIVIGGPPCQEFSNAGKRKEGAIADLTYKYAQIITTLLPQYFVMENVPRVQHSNAYQKARCLYREHGYGLTEIVLDSSRCGVPQKRNRFFCIGSLNDQDNFLLEKLFSHYTEEPLTVRQYFAKHEIPLGIEAYYRHPTTYSRRAVFSVDEIAPTIRGVNRPKPSTYHYHQNDAITEDKLNEITHLSLHQRAIIQTFSPDFQLENLGIPRCDLEQMIGNAVPVALAQFIGHCIKQHISEGAIYMDKPKSFSEWLREEKNYTDRSISDVFSRIKRANILLPNHEINRYYIIDLEAVPQYQELTTSVKSQIRKAISLKLAYNDYLLSLND